MSEIRHLVHINAPANIVYKAITKENGLKGWWTSETIANNKINAIIEFRFGEKYFNKMKIIRLVPDKEVEWVCTHGDREWIGTTFTFDLESDGDRTILRFSHNNWRKATDFFASCNYHWGYYLRSLKLLCETGKGTPFK